ncbi:protein TolR [Moraxella caviae]|nr:protein TolR [Moraxella caviae]
MNVVPYIDVMLVLLVIFMVTAPMLTTGVKVDLPKAATQNLDTADELPVLIAMTADGSLFVSHSKAMDMAVSRDDLPMLLNQLANERAAKGATLRVLINADGAIAYQQIMSLMAQVQAAGIDEVALVSDGNQ